MTNQIQKCRNQPNQFTKLLRYKLESLKLFKQQRQLIDHLNNNDKTIDVMSRGAGKSFSVSVYGLYKFFTSSNIKIAFFSRSQRQSNKLLDIASDIIDQSPALKPSRPHFLIDQKQRLKSHTYSELVALPYDPATVLGEHPDILLLDECAFYDSDEMYGKILKPMLTGVQTTFKIPEIHLTSVFDETSGFFYNMWQQAQKLKLKKFFRNWKQCEGYDPKQVQQDRLDIGEKYYQSQLLCHPTAATNQPYTYELIQKNLSEDVLYNPNYPTYGGIDQAKKRDCAAIAIIQPLVDRIQLLYLQLFKYDYTLLAKTAQTLQNKYRPVSFLVDTTTGEQFTDFSRKPPYSLRANPMSFAGGHKASLLDLLHIQMEQGKMMISPEQTQLTQDMQNYREQKHLPDSIAALSLAVWNAIRTRPKNKKLIAF